MLVIRTGQMEALARPLLAEKILRIMLRAGRAAEADSDAVRALLDAVIVRAMEHHGLATETAIADYAGLALELGPEFDQDPVVSAIMTDPSLPPAGRLQQVFTELSSADWQRLRARAASFTATRHG